MTKDTGSPADSAGERTDTTPEQGEDAREVTLADALIPCEIRDDGTVRRYTGTCKGFACGKHGLLQYDTARCDRCSIIYLRRLAHQLATTRLAPFRVRQLEAQLEKIYRVRHVGAQVRQLIEEVLPGPLPDTLADVGRLVAEDAVLYADPDGEQWP